MKTCLYFVALVGALALLCVEDSRGSVFYLQPMLNIDEDGGVTALCELDWNDELIRIGDEEVYLPTEDGKDCFKCAPCDEDGTSCAQLFRPCPMPEPEDTQFPELPCAELELEEQDEAK